MTEKELLLVIDIRGSQSEKSCETWDPESLGSVGLRKSPMAAAAIVGGGTQKPACTSSQVLQSQSPCPPHTCSLLLISLYGMMGCQPQAFYIIVWM